MDGQELVCAQHLLQYRKERRLEGGQGQGARCSLDINTVKGKLEPLGGHKRSAHLTKLSYIGYGPRIGVMVFFHRVSHMLLVDPCFRATSFREADLIIGPSLDIVNCLRASNGGGNVPLQFAVFGAVSCGMRIATGTCLDAVQQAKASTMLKVDVPALLASAHMDCLAGRHRFGIGPPVDLGLPSVWPSCLFGLPVGAILPSVWLCRQIALHFRMLSAPVAGIQGVIRCAQI